jgi:TolA-binding protein
LKNIIHAKMNSRKLTLILAVLFSSSLSIAQQSITYTDPNKAYREGLELFDKEKFIAAQEQFAQVEKLANENKDNKDYSLLKINAEYYYALCALELFNNDAEVLLFDFVQKYPENPHSKTASFQIGKFYYQQKKYEAAIRWLEKVNPASLVEEEKVEYKFKIAYSYFSLEKYTEAKPYFEQVKGLQSKYGYPATYYYAYIAYLEKNYDVALQNFLILKDSKMYVNIVPYYITNIYYQQGKYKELTDYTKPILTNSSIKNLPEIHRLTASSYYKLDEYGLAVSSYEEYLKKSNVLSSQDNFEIGYSYYQLKRFDKAIEFLKKLSEEKNVYAQTGMYVLGDCFIQSNDKQAARNAFGKSLKLDFDPSVSENALFNYAKISYELQYHQSAIESFQTFIELFPESSFITEARLLLSETLVSTKNYKDAIVILESINSRNQNTLLAYQKATYYRGVEVYNDQDMDQAIALFNKSLTNSIDKTIQSQAYFWKAEALYNKNQYELSSKNFLLSMNNSSSGFLPTYNLANYNLGYCYLNMEDYKSSVFYFDKFLKGNNEDPKKLNDATLRMADGYFVIKNYDKALWNYNKIINEKQSGSDYALYQKGMILGLQNKQNDKIMTLQNLLTFYPKSPYADDAYYEVGNSQFAINNINEAIGNFNKLINAFPTSRYVPKAKLSLGLIYYNQNDDNKALNAYKSVITQYPGSTEAKEALLAIKNIYVDQGNADAYLSYVNTLPFASVSMGAQDSITFQAANNRYLLGDCNNAINGFDTYIDKFPSGIFITEAHYNRGECLIKNNADEEKIILDYNYLVINNATKYLERALVVSSRIYFKQQKYKEAVANYIKLEQIAEFKENYGEAIVGAMKCYNELQDCNNTAKYANKVIAYERSSTEDLNRAHLYLGKCHLASNRVESALTEFNIVTKNTTTETGAEAKYLIALIQYNKGDYLNSQNTCFELGNQIPSYEYWIAKAFILLADNYLKLGNEFQARSTLQSIIDEYTETNDDILVTAKKKLEELPPVKQ